MNPHRKGRAGIDRWATLNQFVDGHLAALGAATGGHAAAAVWLTLFRLADARDGTCRVGYRRLAALSGCTAKTAQAAARALAAAGLIAIDATGPATLFTVAHQRRRPRPDAPKP